MHRLLQRQLKRYVGSVDSIPEEWQSFIDAVNEAYHQTDADRALLERSLDLTSEELIERNRQLEQQVMTERERTQLMEEQSLALLDVIQSVALGDLDVEVETPEGIDVLSDLAIGLEMMVDDLREMLAELEEARAELEQRVAERTQELEAALEGIQSAQRRYLRQEWEGYTTTAQASQGYLLSESAEEPNADAWLPAMTAAVQQVGAVTESDGQEGQTLAVPLSLYGEVIGVLGFSREKAEGWSEDEIATVEAIVEQVALALESRRLFDEEQQASFLLGERVKDLNYLNDIGQKMEETPPVPEFLQWVAERIPSAMRYSDVCLAAIEFEGQVYGTAEAVNLPCQIVQALRVGGQVVGRVYISYIEEHNFLDEESALLGDIVRRVDSYIENRHLFEETQARAEELAVLNELGQALTARLGVEEVLEEAYRGASRLLDTTNFYIGLYDPERDEINFAFDVGESVQDQEISVISADQGLAGYIIRNRTGLLLEENVREQQEALGIEMVGEEALSWLGVPLIVGDRVLGAMSVQSFTTPHLYTEHDRDLLTAIASPMAIALQNAYLFEQTEAALAEVRRLAAIVENHPDFIGVGTLDGQALYVNPAGLKMMGLPSDHDVTMMDARDFYLAEDAQKLVKEGIPAALEEGSWSAEATLLKADGTTIPVEQTIGINYDADGKPYSFSITMRDISERKAAAEALRVSEERFALAVQGANDGIWDWDIQDNSLYWSPRLKELLGYADDELDIDFDTFDSLLHPDDKESTGAAIEVHLKDRGLYNVEQRLRTKSGEYRWFRARGQALWDEAGNPLRMVGSTTDITERKQAEAERERLLTETENLAKELAVLNELGQALTTRLSVEGVLEEAYRGASRLLDTTNFYIGLYDSEKDEVAFVLDVSESEIDKQITVMPVSQGITAHIIRNRQPVLIQESVSERMTEMGIKIVGELPLSWVGVPLIVGDQVLGVMGVQSFTTSRLYDEHDRDLLTAIASPMAIAIQNARLFQETQARARRERILREITARVRGSTDSDAIVRTAVRELGTALGRPTFVRLGNAEQPSPISVAQADGGDGQSTAQQRQHPELVEGGE